MQAISGLGNFTVSIQLTHRGTMTMFQPPALYQPPSVVLNFMKSHYKDYNFTDWINLSEDLRRDIQNHYWTPFEPEIGKKTRNLILEEFIKTIGKDFFLCEFGYFAHYIIGIKYIPNDSKKKVPNEFYGIIINKGKIIERISNEKIKVNWRHSGTEILTINA